MKKQSIVLGIILVGMALFMSSCVKDQSSVEGQITYIGEFLGEEFLAEDAQVELDHMSYDNGVVYTDENGDYQFDNVMDGEYRLKASVTVNGFEHSGISQSFLISGDQIKTVNLILD